MFAGNDWVGARSGAPCREAGVHICCSRYRERTFVRVRLTQSDGVMSVYTVVCDRPRRRDRGRGPRVRVVAQGRDAGKKHGTRREYIPTPKYHQLGCATRRGANCGWCLPRGWPKRKARAVIPPGTWQQGDRCLPDRTSFTQTQIHHSFLRPHNRTAHLPQNRRLFSHVPRYLTSQPTAL